MHHLVVKPRFGELDPYNHVNHSVYVAWFEAGRGEALESVRLGLHDMAETGFQIVVTDLSVRYKRAARAGQQFVIETEVAELRGASSIWSQRLVSVDTNEVYATAEVRGGFCDSNGRPTRVPAEIRARLEPLLRAEP